MLVGKWKKFEQKNCLAQTNDFIKMCICIPTRKFVYQCYSKAYSNSSQTSKMKLFANIVNGFQPLAISAKSSFSDIRLSSEYVSNSNLSLSRKVFTRFTYILHSNFFAMSFEEMLFYQNILIFLKRGLRMGQNTEIRSFRLLCLWLCSSSLLYLFFIFVAFLKYWLTNT